MTCAIISDGKELAGEKGEYIDENKYYFSVIRSILRFKIDTLLSGGYDEYYLNCACGTSIWAGYYLAFLSKSGQAKLHLILPFENMSNGWSCETKKKFSVICKNAADIRYAAAECTADCYAASENLLIDSADLTLLCGTVENNISKADRAFKNKRDFMFLQY